MIDALGPESSARDSPQIVVDGSHQPAVGFPIALSPRHEQRGYIIVRSHETVRVPILLPRPSARVLFIVATLAT